MFHGSVHVFTFSRIFTRRCSTHLPLLRQTYRHTSLYCTKGETGAVFLFIFPSLCLLVLIVWLLRQKQKNRKIKKLLLTQTGINKNVRMEYAFQILIFYFIFAFDFHQLKETNRDLRVQTTRYIQYLLYIPTNPFLTNPPPLLLLLL